ncbi:hypothetical protein [Lancefieldella parvula]|uniref:hypothetical protein n=1 Tax=Lancefieldella parvula TaxID=1382 RepID=UPI0028D1724F|nr:hypothetical protein [Lancefieldella parvula]
MCDKANRAEKPEAHKDAVQVAAAATATPQVAAAATATAKASTHKDTDSKKAQVVDPEFARAENEDDDGYDPYSDRRPVSEPLFERDPWS